MFCIYIYIYIQGLDFAAYRISEMLILFCCYYKLSCIDGIEHRLLHEIEVTELDAFIIRKLAPLRCMRNIAMLCFLHRVAWGIDSQIVRELLKWNPRIKSTVSLRALSLRHLRQTSPAIPWGADTLMLLQDPHLGARLFETSCQQKLCCVHQPNVFRCDFSLQLCRKIEKLHEVREFLRRRHAYDCHSIPAVF